jgi:hypothetical protein
MKRFGLVALSGLLLAVQGAAQSSRRPERLPVRPTPAPDPRPRVVPRFEALAETRLLMAGLANANYRGLEKLLKKEPADVDTWTFARGQALLVAETGNLLLLRPPRSTPARDAWMQRAMDLRAAAGKLARAAGTRDYEASRSALAGLADACNRCHTTFRVSVRVGPRDEEEAPPKEPPPKDPERPEG